MLLHATKLAGRKRQIRSIIVVLNQVVVWIHLYWHLRRVEQSRRVLGEVGVLLQVEACVGLAAFVGSAADLAVVVQLERIDFASESSAGDLGFVREKASVDSVLKVVSASDEVLEVRHHSWLHHSPVLFETELSVALPWVDLRRSPTEVRLLRAADFGLDQGVLLSNDRLLLNQPLGEFDVLLLQLSHDLRQIELLVNGGLVD